MYHIPVLLQEGIDGLMVRPGGTYLDVTYGGGGHSREILRRLGPEGRLFAMDQDPEALKNEEADPRLVLIRGNFRFLSNFLRYHGVEQIHGLFADLGVSSHHFDVPGRGFTFQAEAPLDMRMNPNARQKASQILNEYTEERLFALFAEYGEIENARSLAAKIVKFRQDTSLKTNLDLIAAAGNCVPRFAEHKYLARVFQALRIEVNGELINLRALLEQAVKVLLPGGRLSIITYHSLEDRMVKQFVRQGQFQGEAEKDIYGRVRLPFRAMNSRVITPSATEIASNPRARSAKLRVAERNKEE